MRLIARYVLLLAAVVLCWTVCSVAYAEGTLRTVLVIDASSSMRSTDPKGLRKVAAELYVDLARDGDQLAVTGFDGGVRESMGSLVTIRSPADRAKLKEAIRAVGNDGAWTDFTAGLSEAKRLLDAAQVAPGDQEFVVFLTDGKCDPDPKGVLAEARKAAGVPKMEEFCQQRVLGDIVPQLSGARVYAIGLSRSAPKAFLEDLARRTGGVGLTSERAEELPRLFADVYARLLGSTLVEGVSGGGISIEVDDGAASLDVVLVGPPTLTAQLLDPTGAEVSKDNRRPEEVYYVDSPAYRFFKVQNPAVGIWKLTSSGGAGGRYVALQNLDLQLGFVNLPEVSEIGKERSIRVRLATRGGKVPPFSFLDRHEVSLRVAEDASDCLKALETTASVPLRRGGDGTYEVKRVPTARGEMCVQAMLVPGSGGVLSRVSAPQVLRIVPPLRLAGSVVDFGSIKQDSEGTGTLNLEGSEIGEPIEVEIALFGRQDLSLDPEKLEVAPKGGGRFKVTLGVDRDAKPGRATLDITIRPIKPKGYEERGIRLQGQVTVVALSFWERYGFWIKVGSGVLLFLLLLFGYVLPAGFKKRTMLYYQDVRDPDLPREGSYPLGVKAKSGFYRGARQLVGPTGPVRRGGVLELFAGAGGSVNARPLGGRSVSEARGEDGNGFGSPRENRKVSMKEGVFRCSLGVKYEVEGAGLVFWIDVK